MKNNLFVKVFNEHNYVEYVKFLNERASELDIYYWPEFLKLDAVAQKGKFEIFTAYRDSSVFIYPYIKFQFDSDGKTYEDISSPYGYCGPYVNDPAFMGDGERIFNTYAKEQGFVTEFVRYHYNYNKSTLLFDQNITNIENRTIVLLSLNQSWEDIWMKEFSKTNRNITRRLINEGYSFELTKTSSAVDEFINMYYATMHNAHASDFYYFEKDYFVTLMDELGDKIELARVIKGGITFSTSLFFLCGGNVIYYLSARNLEFPQVPAGNLILSEMVKYCHKRGLKFFNFGGGNTNDENDFLYKFKRNFSKNCVPFFIGKRIHNLNAHSQLKEAYIAKYGLKKFEENKNILQFYKG